MELDLFGTFPLRVLIMRAAPCTANERGVRPKKDVFGKDVFYDFH